MGRSHETNAMANRFSEVLHRLVEADNTDATLLSRYVGECDEEAFQSLARRHGPMVLSVCRRILVNVADAEDAYQATFLILVRKANAIREPSHLANWLFGVARNVALKARQARTRRKRKETNAAAKSQQVVVSDFAELLHAHLAKLPTDARVVIVLCDLEGRTLADAARQLGIPVGTVASRLTRGRTTLAKKLMRLGLQTSGGFIAALLCNQATASPLPWFSLSDSPSLTVETLTQEVLRAMSILPTIKKLVATMVAGVTLLAVVAVGSPAQAPPAETPKPKAPAPKVEKPVESPFKPFAPFFVLWQAVPTWESDDKISVMIEVPTSRNFKLLDAKMKPVFVTESSHQRAGPLSVDVKELQLFDFAGNKKPQADWKKLLKDGVPVLYVVEELYDLKLMRKEFSFCMRDDALVLMMSRKMYDKYDPFKNLSPIESLPQEFVGQPSKTGDPNAALPPKK